MTRVLNLVAFAVFATTLFVRAVDPVLSQIAGDLAVDPATAALLSTAFAMPYALMQPVLLIGAASIAAVGAICARRLHRPTQ